MKRFLFILTLLLTLPTLGQRLFVYPSTVKAPKGSYETVTAVVNGVNNKTVTWSITSGSGGTLVGTNPCVVNEPCTIALYSTTATTYTLKATSNANSSVTGTSTITMTASPTPVTSHPRLLITAAMLTGLQAKAVNTNPMYESLLNQGIADYNNDNAKWGTAGGGGGWSCQSGTGLPKPGTSPTIGIYGQTYLAQNAQIYALLSMLDPSDATYHWGCYGHDTWMYLVNAQLSSWTWGQDDVRRPATALATTTDWLLAGSFLSSGEQSTIRSFLTLLVQKDFTTFAFTAPGPGNNNSPGLWNYNSTTGFVNFRMMGNNYLESMFPIAVGAALTFNDTTGDDPALTNTCSATRYQVCSDFTAGSLHAYWNYFAGTQAYLYWALTEDPAVSLSAYTTAYGAIAQPDCNMNGNYVPCLGNARNGEATEGSWYGYSRFSVRNAMNMAHTAGYVDPLIWGPQMSLDTSSYWDLSYISSLEFLTGFSNANNPTSAAYSYLQTGDSNAYQRSIGDFLTEMEDMTADSYVGRTDRIPALEWLILNASYGGPLGTSGGCTNNCGFIGNMGAAALDFYISLPATNPVSSPPSDPRPSLPLELYTPGNNQHIITRSAWSGGTFFTYWADNALTTHENQIGGGFDLLNCSDSTTCEYFTKRRMVSADDYNYQMSAAQQSNVLSICNSTWITTGPCNITPGSAYEWGAANYGGQWFNNVQPGLITLLHQESPAYVAAIVDLFNVYNSTNPSINDITAASRSLIYLRGTNQVVYYDRAVVGHAASVQSTWLNTTGSPTISGNTASWLTRSTTQKAYYTTLLPSGATLANNALVTCPSAYVDCSPSAQATDWEPYSQLSVTPSGTPLSSQFLSVLEFGSSSLSKSTTTLVQSSSSQSFDGALVGSSLVMFMRNWPATFTSVTYPASGATTDYVSDLSPNTTYSISGAGAPSTATTDAAGVLTFAATGAGNVTIHSSGPPPKMNQGAVSHLTQYKIPLCISAAAVSLLVVGHAAYRGARSRHSQEMSVNE
jgi:hypothetical protein